MAKLSRDSEYKEERLNTNAQEDEAQKYTDTNVSSIKGVLTDNQLWKLSKVIADYCELQSGKPLFYFQKPILPRAIYALFKRKSVNITALFARQMGKTEAFAQLINGLIVILPLLAKSGMFEDPRITRFASGIRVGLFSGTYWQAGMLYNRMRQLFTSKHSVQFLASPEIGIDVTKIRFRHLTLPNGSFVDMISAGPGAHIEGGTYDIICLEETQDMPYHMIRDSIKPMALTTGAPFLIIGTPLVTSPGPNFFQDICMRNRDTDVANKAKLSESEFEREQLFFKYDYTYRAKIDPVYKETADDFIEEAGGKDSDTARAKYFCEFPTSAINSFISEPTLNQCAIYRTHSQAVKKGTKDIEFNVQSCVQDSEDKATVIIGIDFGKSIDSTVLTAGKVWYENEITVGTDVAYKTHIIAWKEILGDNHEAQYPQMIEFIKQFPTCKKIVCDSTTAGSPICERLAGLLLDNGLNEVVLEEFNFSSQSKHNGYSLFLRELASGRFTFPYAKEKRTREATKFFNQMLGLEQTWNTANLRVVQAPKKVKDAHDDFPDSAMMLCWGVNGGQKRVEIEINAPFSNIRRSENVLVPKNDVWVGSRYGKPYRRRPGGPSNFY